MRQKILDEGNRLALKESSLRNEIELKSKELLMERDLLARRYKDAEKKIDELSEFKEKYSRQMQEGMAQYKIDLNREHASLLASVEVEKTKLEGERAMLNERAAVTEQMLNNVKHSQRDIETTRENLREAQTLLSEATKERDSLQIHVKELQLQLLTHKGSTALEFELSSMKTQLMESERDNQERQKEYQALLQKLVDTDGVQVDKVRRDAMKWQQECQSLVVRLDEEMGRNDSLQRKYDQEVVKTRQLKRDLTDMKLLVHQTRTALTQEIAQQNQENYYPHLVRT